MQSRTRVFRHTSASAGLFDNGNVSECAADIDADPPVNMFSLAAELL
jgi:hypothetical protein